MAEETITICVSELMAFPPTFGENLLPEKESWLKRFRKLNPFRYVHEFYQRAVVKKLFDVKDDPNGPCEVMILGENEEISPEMAKLIRESFYR